MSGESEINNAEFVPGIARQIRDELFPQLSVELVLDDQRAVISAIVRAADLGMRRGETEAFANINHWWHGLTLERRLGLATVDPLVKQRVLIDDSEPDKPDD